MNYVIMIDVTALKLLGEYQVCWYGMSGMLILPLWLTGSLICMIFCAEWLAKIQASHLHPTLSPTNEPVRPRSWPGLEPRPLWKGIEGCYERYKGYNKICKGNYDCKTIILRG